MPQKGKKKKKTGGAKRAGPKSAADDGAATCTELSLVKTEAAQAKENAAAWLVAEKAEIEHMEGKMARDNGW